MSLLTGNNSRSFFLFVKLVLLKTRTGSDIYLVFLTT